MARIKHYNSITKQWEYSDISSAVKGDPGVTPNLTIGTVTTLSPGKNATATITGTAENPILNLGLPKGEAGSGGSSSGGLTQVFHAGTSAPSNTNLLWVDTNSTTGGLKYYNGTSWVHVPVAYT